MPRKKKTAPDHGPEIAAYFVAAIEKGIENKWTRPWGMVIDSDNMNGASKTGYSILNNMYLNASAHANGFTTHVWFTAKQAMSAGWNIKGKKSVAWVMKPNQYKKKDANGAYVTDSKGNNVMGWGKPKYAALFNAEQFEEYEAPATVAPVAKFTDDKAIETYCDKTGASIIHRGNRAFYSIGSDGITLPPKEAFKDAGDSTALEGYYGTKFHELVHWTGAESRLNRNIKNSFGSEAYAYEELVAEIGAAILCKQHNISDTPREDHTTYIKSWLDGIKKDNGAILTAAKLASAAVAHMNKMQ